MGALVPREFGLQRKNIAKIGCGDYHSFAIERSGKVYSWGLNTFGQTGVPKDEDDENNTIKTPTVVERLSNFNIKQIVGGGHHTLSVTESGQVLIWGRIDNAQGGIEVSKLNKDDLFFDENEKPRFLVKPAVLPDIDGEFVAAATDNCLVITKGGEAYSWGFSANYQTGQGTTEDIKVATRIDNTAVRHKKLVWCGAGGQFSVLAGEAEEKPIINGI
jgi:regulator of chromosome condensation